MRNWNSFRTASLSVLLSVLVSIAGCGDPDAPEIGRVTGTVTRGGQPVPNVTLNFMPDVGRPSWGITDSEGFYELEYNADYKGAKVDHHKVYVVFNPTSIDGSGGGGSLSPEEQQAVREKYGNEEVSPLEFDVVGGTQIIDIQLD